MLDTKISSNIMLGPAIIDDISVNKIVVLGDPSGPPRRLEPDLPPEHKKKKKKKKD